MPYPAEQDIPIGSFTLFYHGLDEQKKNFLFKAKFPGEQDLDLRYRIK
jgi:hypothetical protein